MDSRFFGQALAYADLWQWIIGTCNLLVLDGAVVSQSKKKKPFDDVTRRQILELLCWQGIMRASLRAAIFSPPQLFAPRR